MGKNILVIGLTLNLLFANMVHVVADAEHVGGLLALLEASDVHRDGLDFVSANTGLDITLKIPLFRSVGHLLEICPFSFTPSGKSFATLDDHSEIGKERLLSILYPAHTFP